MWRTGLVSLSKRSALGIPTSTSKTWTCANCTRRQSTATHPKPQKDTIAIDDLSYPIDSWTNVPSNIIAQVPRRLHTLQDHPICITRQLIESHFPNFKKYSTFPPVVTTQQNFDSLLFPVDHVGRSRSDTYYVNQSTVLRTHTSAHQADVFRANDSDGFLISADVYRRDAVDKSHYPIFHQMEGALTWDTTGLSSDELQHRITCDFKNLIDPRLQVELPQPLFRGEDNPLQKEHAAMDKFIDVATLHLMRSLELVVATIFKHMPLASSQTASGTEEPLRVRWVPAYFPFTSPSFELEVFWNGDWLEVLGCGIVRQQLLVNAGVPNRVGWAFGLGLDRLAMLLFQVPDIRLFWSQDARFLSQFKEPHVTSFKPFSRHPACPKDVSFWIPAAPTGEPGFHENDFMELVRSVCGDIVEDVALLDEFAHPKTGRQSKAYRVNYRSLERTLTNDEVNELHEKLRKAMVEILMVELR